jgi:DNA-binding XRE family transcriptional regulator
MNLEKTYADIIKRYPEYVTQTQMCDICGISKKTAYKLERNGKIPYTVEVNHLIHTHKIKLTDILLYLYEKDCRQEPDSLYILAMRDYYKNQFKRYPDMLTAKMIEHITGFSNTGVGNWLQNGKLKSKMIKKRYMTPKTYLIDFMVSPYYRRIKNKSDKQKKYMGAFEEHYKEVSRGTAL